jgi:2-C-methyl-D-erythritol 4-phosphate cytidylyltransferase
MSFTSAVIVAAGKGTRMGPNVDKLFLEVAGRPVVAHAWAMFDASPVIDEIILVIRDPLRADFEKIRADLGFKKPVRFASGGAERQNSVWNGLERISPEAEIVAIQDGARPCTMQSIIEDCVVAAREFGASVAAQKVTDTLKEADARGLIVGNIDRSKLWAVQTPQVFRVEILRKALQEVFKRGMLVTDDTAACELIGRPVKLVESKTPNPKVTTPGDLPLIDLILRQRKSEQELDKSDFSRQTLAAE